VVAFRGSEGLALPLAMLSLLLFSSLALALLAVAQTEPTIAANHLRAAQARALADSGLAHALAALGDTGAPAAGFQEVGSTGGFELTMTGTDANARVVRSVGRSDGERGARATVIATLVRVRDLARELPCALCIAGPVTLGASLVDARGSETTDCGRKTAVLSAAALTLAPSSAMWGGGAPSGTPPSVEGRDWRANEPFVGPLSSEDLRTLKALAVLRGRYVRATSDAAMRLGDLPPGLVFVDTPYGVANVVLGPPAFRGWLVVNGNVTLEAAADVEGLVYATNTLTAEPSASVTGAVVAAHASGGESVVSALDVRFECAAAAIAGAVPRGWFMRPGTYCDGSAGC
jgi:hypothetical protein